MSRAESGGSFGRESSGPDGVWIAHAKCMPVEEPEGYRAAAFGFEGIKVFEDIRAGIHLRILDFLSCEARTLGPPRA